MSKTPLISTLFVGAIILLIGIFIQQSTNPEQINATAHTIADFDLPTGYQPDYMLDVSDYTIAAYKSDNGQSHLAFVQVPENVIPDDEVIEGHVFGGWSRKSQRHATVLSTEQPIIRNQPATLTISERINGEGQLYRSAYLVFEGHSGTAVIVFNQPATQWNQTLVDSFIASIR